MADKKIPWVDDQKFKEIMHEISVVKLNISQEKLEEMKEKLWDDYKDIELWRLQGMLDLYNTGVQALLIYQERYGHRKKRDTERSNNWEVPEHNRERHKAHRYNTEGKIDEHIDWHLEHRNYCRCGFMPQYIRDEIQRRRGK